MVEIPQDIAQDAAQAAIWSELVADDSRFTEQDVPPCGCCASGTPWPWRPSGR